MRSRTSAGRGPFAVGTRTPPALDAEHVPPGVAAALAFLPAARVPPDSPSPWSRSAATQSPISAIIRTLDNAKRKQNLWDKQYPRPIDGIPIAKRVGIVLFAMGKA